ncbi:MAG: hypothetical protein RL404_802 [Pseudomonadota bacterium]
MIRRHFAAVSRQPVRVVVISLAVLAGCGSCTDAINRPDPVDQSTPAKWQYPGKWVFTLVGRAPGSGGFFELELTDQPAKTCIGGSWRRAVPTRYNLSALPVGAWWSDQTLWPAYLVEGRSLTVLLNGGGVCDSYPQVSARLSEDFARGSLQWSGLVRSKNYGSIRVVPVQ